MYLAVTSIADRLCTNICVTRIAVLDSGVIFEISCICFVCSHMNSAGPVSRDVSMNRQLSAPCTARVSNSAVTPRILASHDHETL